jgi:pimeloyl-ACP methyl ester carboxylesterase
MEQLELETRHGRLAVRRSGEGPAVLLLHGVPGSGAVWGEVADGLADDATVLVPDLLGFGASSKQRDLRSLHAQAQAEALDDALATLGLDGLTVVGHDFGGPVALMLVGRSPWRVARLGLLATNTFSDTPIPFPLSMLEWPLIGRFAGLVLFSRPSLSLMLTVGSGRPPRRLDRATHLGDAEQVRSIRTVFEGSLRNLAQLFTPVQGEFERWHGPAFVAWGDRDPFFPLAQGRRTADVAGVPLTVLQGAGHFLPQERPQEVVAAIRTLMRADVVADAGGAV